MRLSLLSSVLLVALLAPASAEGLPPLKLAEPGANASQNKDYYRAIVTEFTGDLCRDTTWVLGLRGMAPDGSRRDSAQNTGGYVDTWVVITPGEEPVGVFRSATHAGTARSADQPFGVAQLRPGRYLAEPLHGGPEVAWTLLGQQQSSSKLPAWLDRDGNGVLSDEEKALDEHYQTTTKGVAIRDGGDALRPQRVGAQTLSPDDYKSFVAMVGKRQSFQYLLIDANRPVKEEVRDLRTLATPLSPPDAFVYYEKLAVKKGVDRDFELLVILLRGIAPNGSRHDSADNVGHYNDTFLVLDRRDRSVIAHRGSAHAGQASTTRSPGYYAGIAQLRPGLYWARSNNVYHGYWSWHIVNNVGDYQGHVPAWRDRDKDGYISESERLAAERNGVIATEILIHNGIDPDTGDSIGCLTMPPSVIVRFIDKVGEGSSFPLLLLDANAGP